MPRILAAVLGALVFTLMPAAPASAQPSELRRVSERPNGGQANGGSGAGTLSRTGRLIAFASSATNLVRKDTNDAADIFLYDVETDETTLLTHDRRGGPTNGDSVGPAISAGGRFVAFISTATDLVAGAGNGVLHVFVLDRRTEEVELVSRRKNGVPGNGDSSYVSISADGRYVAFSSRARNLSRLPDKNHKTDVFVHDRKTGTINRVSVSSEGEEGNDESFAVGVSDDGSRVGFLSFASNLVPDDTNGWGDAFVYDRDTQTTIRASVSSTGEQSKFGGQATDFSSNGRHVVFYTFSDDLVEGDTNDSADIFVHDLETGVTERVSVATGGEGANNFSHNQAEIDASGCSITFDSGASNLAPGDTRGIDVFLRDRCADETIRLSVKEDGTEANGDSSLPHISPDGTSVTFNTEATNLDGPDTNEVEEVFLAIR